MPSRFLAAIFCLALSALVWGGTSVPAAAQDSRHYQQRADRIGLALIRVPEAPSDNFILRLSSLDIFSGCPRLSNFEHEVTVSGPVMRVSVGPYTVDMRNLPKYPHLECQDKASIPSAKIPLSREMIKNKNIQEIEFKNGRNQDRYKLIMTGEFIQLSPMSAGAPSMMAHVPQDIYRVKNPLKYWLYPERTVQLYIPGADMSDRSVAARLDEFAAGHNLTPLTDIFPDFEPPLVGMDYVYYVDEAGSLPDTVIENNKRTILGTVDVKTDTYGLEGRKTEIAPMQVYVKLPGMYE